VNSLKQILKKIDFLKVAQLLLMTFLIVLPLLLNTHFASAQLNKNLPCDSSTGLNCQATSVNGLIKIVINWLLGIAFAVAVLFLIIGGFWYITSAGNEETAEKGKGTAVNAIIGIVIIIMSYVIINVISNLVSNPSSSSAP
jgi:hypothetical protein